MPNMANIVVKKADGTTNYTFTVLSGAAGDGSFAQWRGEGSTPALAANLRLKTLWNAKKDQRRTEISGAYPKVETVAGVNTVTSIVPFSFMASMPQNFTAAEANDAAAVISNVIASALVRESVATGVSPG